jgi:cytochrome c551/c552
MPFHLRTIIFWLVGIFVAIQVIPVPRTNPVADPAAALRATRPAGDAAVAILDRSCRDCHTNDTVYPWYSRVAPASWLLYRDVSGGRRHMNLSEFSAYDATQKAKRLKDVCEEVTDGDMPPWFYLPMHPDAKLRPGDVETLCALSAEAPAPRP